jgi:hypothetical protein
MGRWRRRRESPRGKDRRHCCKEGGMTRVAHWPPVAHGDPYKSRHTCNDLNLKKSQNSSEESPEQQATTTASGRVLKRILGCQLAPVVFAASQGRSGRPNGSTRRHLDPRGAGTGGGRRHRGARGAAQVRRLQRRLCRRTGHGGPHRRRVQVKKAPLFLETFVFGGIVNS